MCEGRARTNRRHTHLDGLGGTAETVPVIRCKRGGAAEQVARKLDSRLRDHVKDGGFRDSATRLQRPLLIIADRTLDLNPMLSHAWTYQALAHDVLGMRLNRLTVPVRIFAYSVVCAYGWRVGLD
jgi:hypothetical protein